MGDNCFTHESMFRPFLLAWAFPHIREDLVQGTLPCGATGGSSSGWLFEVLVDGLGDECDMASVMVTTARMMYLG